MDDRQNIGSKVQSQNCAFNMNYGIFYYKIKDKQTKSSDNWQTNKLIQTKIK